MLDALRDHLATHDTHLALANLHRIDIAGHVGVGTLYADLVAEADGPVVEFWRWLEDTEPYAGHTTLVVTADHGRHRWGEPQDWRNQGDQCAGCRQVPLLVLGLDVIAGATVDTTYTLVDLHATVAALLGVDAAWSRGSVIAEIFDEAPEAPQPSGVCEIAQASGTLVGQVWEDRRTAITSGDTLLSNSTAMLGEAPVALGDMTCWRELQAEPGEDGEWAWTGLCRRRVAHEWRDIGFPEDRVSPCSRPDLARDRTSRTWLAYAFNPYGYTGATDVRPRLARWEGGWQTDPLAGPKTSLPLDIRLALDSDGTAW